MLVPMILKTRTANFKLWAALLDPVRRPSAVLRNQTLNVTNTLAFRDDAGVRQHLATELRTGLFFLHWPHFSSKARSPRGVLAQRSALSRGAHAITGADGSSALLGGTR